MARPTKPAPFAIYEDVETKSARLEAPGDDDVWEEEKSVAIVEQVDCDAQSDEEAGTIENRSYEEDMDGSDADDERRESAQTRDSISSIPESTYHTDADNLLPTHPPYTPPIIRPAFMRPESVRRMQMASPPPFSSRSPRRSIARPSSSRNATPKSIRSATAKGSPRPRKFVQEDAETSHDEKEYPLVLLHVAIIPVAFPWSQQSMEDLLPESAVENMEVLKTKLSETVLQRGVLIPHPRHEYELLEERLLEALELKEERITKCGHFRNRPSASSDSSAFSSGRDSDSGIGSSVDGDFAGMDMCLTCNHQIKQGKSAVDKKWTIEVYAANGLMRSSAWAAAWNQMERVDVQIMPFISEETRRKLNERREVEAAEAAEEIWQAQELEENDPAIERSLTLKAISEPQINDLEPATTFSTSEKMQAEIPTPTAPRQAGSTELPNVYKKASDVPMSLLLKNYISLLAREPKNVAIFCLMLGLLFVMLRPSSSATSELGNVSVISETTPDNMAVPASMAPVLNATMEKPFDPVNVAQSSNRTVEADMEHDVGEAPTELHGDEREPETAD